LTKLAYRMLALVMRLLLVGMPETFRHLHGRALR